MSSLNFKKKFACALALTAAAALASGCADSTDGSHAEETEQAFLTAMAPHHESAIAMAGMASNRAAHPRLKLLADAIVDAQQAEIAKIALIHMRLTGEALRANADAHQQLGLSAEQAGMMHGGPEEVAELKRAKPFDRAFIDAMVPHHQGAIRMARAVLAVTDDAEVRRLAEGIVADQSREIGQMNRWRAAWYGRPSPAGGVPKGDSADEEPMDGSEREPGGGHEGH